MRKPVPTMSRSYDLTSPLGAASGARDRVCGVTVRIRCFIKAQAASIGLKSWGTQPIGGTTPCKAERPCPHPCTGSPAVEPGRGPGRRAGHPRWRTVGAGCTGAHPPVLRSVTPMPATTAAIVPRRSPSGGKSRHSSARYAAWWRRSTGRTEKRKRIGPLGFLLQFRVPL